MTTRFFATLAAALAVGSATGTNDTVAVRNFRHAGAFPLPAPVMIDTVDVNSHSYSVKSILDSPLNFDAALAGATEFTGEILPAVTRRPLSIYWHLTLPIAATPSRQFPLKALPTTRHLLTALP